MWHCPCLGCPKRGKLPQMGQLAAPNGAACCPFGAGFGLPQLSRQRSCHALHTGISALYVLRCDLVCNIAPRKIALTTSPKFQRNSSAKTWSGKDGFFPVGYLLVVFFGAIFPSMVQIFALLVHFGANFLRDQCTLPRLVAYFTVWWFRAAAPWLNCSHLIYFDWWLMIWLLMIRLVVVGVSAWAMNTKQLEWFRMVLLWIGYIICKERKAELVYNSSNT